MRRNFDYVTFADYESDMKESTDRALAAIAAMKDRAERAEKALAAVVLAAGEVVVPNEMLIDHGKIELTTWWNEADNTYSFSAKRT